MIKKYLVTIAGKQYYIVKLYITKIENILRFGYDIYLITNKSVASMIGAINQSFINNPESDAIFNKLSSEKKFTKTLSQLEALEIVHNLEKILNNNAFPNFIKVDLPLATLYLEPNKVKLLYNFIKHFCDNYELIKLEIDKTIDETKNITNKQEYKIENENIVIDEKEISSKIFHELIKLSPNNLITFFILKQLSSFYTNQKIEFNLNETGELSISVTKLTNNLMLLYNDLLTVINFKPNNISNEEYKNLIKSRINLLIKIIVFIYENETKLNTNDKYLYLNFILIVLYIYGFWLNDSNLNSSPNIYGFVNKLLSTIKLNNKLKYIKFNSLPLEQNSNVININLATINKLASKYNYLIDIDRNKFISNIINDTKQLLNNINNNSINIQLPLNKAKLIDLLSNNLPLKYKKIEDIKLSNHKIISEPYHSLLILENSKTILSLDNIDEKLPKLIDVIQNKIIPDLNKFSEQLILNPSTLFIYTECIEPHIHTHLLSIEEKLYLLYDISIPYLFDRYNISKFLDYFH